MPTLNFHSYPEIQAHLDIKSRQNKVSGENVSQNLVYTAYSRSGFGGLQRAEVKKLD